MTIEELKEIKRQYGLTNYDISQISGVPLSTVQKIFGGITRSPRKETILTLQRSLSLPALIENPYITQMFEGNDDLTPSPAETPYTDDESAGTAYSIDGTGSSTASHVGETLPEYHVRPKGKRNVLDINHLDRQGHYTIKDLQHLPDNIRAELIDGVITIMEAPSTTHQKIVLYITSQLLPCVEKHPECELLFAPVDVQLDCDNRTMVQPDILVLCDRKKDTIKNIYGAPDFVIEVCSPSSVRKDMMDKLKKYGHAGVREYWIVDPKKERVTKYDFTKDMEMDQFTFDDKVSVSISEGKCEIDFRDVKAHM